MAAARAHRTMNLRFYGDLNTLGTGSMCGTVTVGGLDIVESPGPAASRERGSPSPPPFVPMRSRYNYNINNVFVFISQ